MQRAAQSRFGGFLLHRGCPARTEVQVGSYIPSTGHDGMPCRQYVACGIHIGVGRIAAGNALKPGWRGAVFFRHMPTGRTGPARVAWIDRDHHPAAPGLFILKLTAELEPPLIEDGSVQSRLGADVSPRLFDRPRRRPGQVPYLQILDHDDRVVLAEHRGELMQMVASDVADPGMELLDAGFGPPPVAGKLLLPAHGPLIPGQTLGMTLERMGGSDDLARRQGGEVRHPHIHADDTGRGMHRLLNWALGLDGHEPFAVGLADGDVFDVAPHLPTVAIAQPAELGQKDPAVGLIQPDLLRVGVAETVGPSLLLEARKSARLSKKLV